MGDERSAIAGKECGGLSDAQISVRLSELVMAGGSSEMQKEFDQTAPCFHQVQFEEVAVVPSQRNLDPRFPSHGVQIIKLLPPTVSRKCCEILGDIIYRSEVKVKR